MHRLLSTWKDWTPRGNVKLQRPKQVRRPYVAGIALWHAPVQIFRTM